MELLLTPVSRQTRSIYPVPQGGPIPLRFGYLHPEAAESFARLEQAIGGLVYSDMFRSAADSLVAVTTKTGTQPPGFSAHGYGLAFDVDVETVLKEKKWVFNQLLTFLVTHGWYCHRRDGKPGNEGWHFNYLGDNPQDYLNITAESAPRTWANAAEARIRYFYASAFELTDLDVQAALHKIRFYSGSLDGVIGPVSLQAIHAFQRAWNLPEGPLDVRTKRTLAYITAERKIV